MTFRTLGARLIFAGFLLLLLNSAYLASFSAPTLWYYTQVAVHPILGLALAAVVALAAARRRWAPGRLGAVGLLLCGAGFALGVALFVTGATTAYRPLVNAHIAVSAAGAALLLVSFVVSGFRRTSCGNSCGQYLLVKFYSLNLEQYSSMAAESASANSTPAR